MMKVKPDYCNDCRRDVLFKYVGHDAESVFARCVECGAQYDLINNGHVLREFRRSITDRMAYFLRKANAYQTKRYAYLRCSSAYMPPASRYARLLAYKNALNARIEAERSAGL